MLLLGLILSCKAPESAVERRVVVPIVTINDFHGALAERPLGDDGKRAAGGLPWLAAAIDDLRLQKPDLVLLDGGDTFQGDAAINTSRGLGSVAAFDLLGVDAGAIGNHEFDYGGAPGADPLRGALEEAAKARKAQFLSANIRKSDGSPYAPPGIAPWKMIERNGIQLGVIGLTTTETPQTTLAKNVADLRFEDPVSTVALLAPELRKRGADAIVVVGHLTGSCKPKGFAEPDPECHPDGEIGRLLSELPRGTIDVLVAGHAHTLINQRIGDTFVLEARSHGQILDEIDLVFGPQGLDRDASELHAPWALTHAAVDPGCSRAPFPTAPLDVGGRMLTPKASAIALVTSLMAKAPDLCAPIGCTTHAINRDRGGEAPLGDLVADAMLAQFPTADLAITNSGGLRADLPAGQLRLVDVQSVMPFDNRLELVEVDGAHLAEIVRIGSSGAHGALQVGGHLRYSFDPDNTAGTDRDGDGAVSDWERDRVCAVEVANEPISPSRRYRVATSDFLFGGGDHLGPGFRGATVVAEGPLLRDAIGEYIAKAGGCLDVVPQHRVEVRRGCAAR
jgi:5'-nucleotidase